MPSWDGIEDASAQIQAVWLARLKGSDDEWQPLRHTDCRELNQTTETSVYIEGGRAEAILDPDNPRIEYTLYRGPLRELCSATWFYKKPKGKEFALWPIRDATAVEALYQSALEATATHGPGIQSVISQKVTLDDGNVQIVQKSNQLSLKWSQGWLSTSIPLQRGYGSYGVPGEADEVALGPVTHVAFVIHGIGEAMFSRETVNIPGLITQTDLTRKALYAKQVKDWREARTKQPELPPPGRIELIPVEWFHCLREESSALMRTLQHVTLPTIPALRSIANDVVLDVLLYMTPKFGHMVLETVTTRIRSICERIPKIHPNFANRYSLIGHSLGSVIVWDLLCLLRDGSATASTESVSIQHGTWGPALSEPLESLLPFEPDTTLLLGSPVGLFLSLRGAREAFEGLRGDSQESTFSLPTRRLLNVFHPSDPVAYRIEPLLLPSDLDPIPPPLFLTAPGQDVRFHVKAKQISQEIRQSFHDPTKAWQSLVVSAVSALSEATQTEVGDEAIEETHRRSVTTTKEVVRFKLAGEERNHRVDYSLQTNVIDHEYISAVLAHATSTYFGHDDLLALLATLAHNQP